MRIIRLKCQLAVASGESVPRSRSMSLVSNNEERQELRSSLQLCLSKDESTTSEEEDAMKTEFTRLLTELLSRCRSRSR